MISSIRKRTEATKVLDEQLHEYWKIFHCFVEKLFQQQQQQQQQQ